MNKVAKIIICNSKNEFLLQLRDNNPNIQYPLHWNLFGGVIEENEKPKETIIRELNEELGIIINENDVCFFLKEEYNLTHQYIFYIKKEINPEKIILQEGISLKWFKFIELEGLKIGFNYKKILEKIEKWKPE